MRDQRSRMTGQKTGRAPQMDAKLISIVERPTGVGLVQDRSQSASSVGVRE